MFRFTLKGYFWRYSAEAINLAGGIREDKKRWTKWVKRLIVEQRKGEWHFHIALNRRFRRLVLYQSLLLRMFELRYRYPYERADPSIHRTYNRQGRKLDIKLVKRASR